MTPTKPTPIARRTPGTGHGRLRWYVRLEHARPTRFGEPARAGLMWAVIPYTTRRASTGDPIPIGAPTLFPTLTAAHRYAHLQRTRTYGKDTTR